MIVSRSREKLINAIVFFASNTAMCGKTKLFKLLYLLDAEHFKKTGRTVTGLNYYAWELGPVPVSLAEEWLNWDNDLAHAITIQLEDLGLRNPLEKVVPQRQFDDSHFSRREKELLEEISQRFRLSSAKELVAYVHRPGSPWATIWKDGSGFNELIPHDLALDDMAEKARIQELENRHLAMLRNFSN